MEVQIIYPKFLQNQSRYKSYDPFLSKELFHPINSICFNLYLVFVLQAVAPWSSFHLWPPFLHHASPFPIHLSLSRAADNTSGRSASGSLTGPLSLCFFPSVAFPQYNGHTCETHRCITNHLVDSRIVRLTCSLIVINI